MEEDITIESKNSKSSVKESAPVHIGKTSVLTEDLSKVKLISTDSTQ